MTIAVNARVALALGPEITKRLEDALASYGDPPEQAFANSAMIVASALEGSPAESRKSNAAAIVDFLQGEMVARGFPASAEAMAILAEKAAVDAKNAEVGAETDEAIFRETYIAHYVQIDAIRTPKEEAAYMRRLNELRSEAVRRFGSFVGIERNAVERMNDR